MAQFTGGTTGHHCTRARTNPSAFWIGWTRFVKSRRFRDPVAVSRLTDEKGARRFCKKWGIAFPEDF